MGARANIVIRSSWPDDLGDREAVFLYTHWGNEELPEILRQALAKRWRWDDDSYLARIIFDEMVGDGQHDETGYGISTRKGDGERDLIVLYRSTVYLLPEATYTDSGFTTLALCSHISFEDYIAVDERTWDNLTQPSEVDSA